MTYATVMVGLALDRSNDACLEIAGQLVKRFGACAIGVAAGEFRPPLYFMEGAGPGDIRRGPRGAQKSHR